jgi:hypothetical protein
LVSILKYVFGFLVSDIIVHEVYIESSRSHKISSTPEVLVSGSCSFGRTSIVESDGGFSLEFSDNNRNSNRWWDSQLKMDVIYREVTFYFFYLHLFENIIDDISELYFKFSVYNFLAVFWTKYDVVGTEIIGSMCHELKKDYNINDLPRVFLHVQDIVIFFLIKV